MKKLSLHCLKVWKSWSYIKLVQGWASRIRTFQANTHFTNTNTTNIAAWLLRTQFEVLQQLIWIFLFWHLKNLKWDRILDVSLAFFFFFFFTRALPKSIIADARKLTQSRQRYRRPYILSDRAEPIEPKKQSPAEKTQFDKRERSNLRKRQLDGFRRPPVGFWFFGHSLVCSSDLWQTGRPFLSCALSWTS